MCLTWTLPTLYRRGNLLVDMFLICPSLCGCLWAVGSHYYESAALTLFQELQADPENSNSILHSRARKAFTGPLNGSCPLATLSVLPSPHPTRARAELCHYPHTPHCLHIQSQKPQIVFFIFFFKVEVWFWASQVALVVKNPPANAGNMSLSFDPRVGKIPWRRKWQPTPVFLSGESYGHRSLASYPLWGHKDSDMTEVIQHLGSQFTVCQIQCKVSFRCQFQVQHKVFLFRYFSTIGYYKILNIVLWAIQQTLYSSTHIMMCIC